MPKYRIETDNGTFEVDADSEALALQALAPSPQPNAMPGAQSGIGPLRTFGQQFMNSFTFGTADEIAAAGIATLEGVDKPATFEPRLPTFGFNRDTFNDVVESEALNREAGFDENTGAAIGGAVTGALAQGVGAAKQLPRAASALGNIARGTGAATSIGALQGFNEGTDLESRVIGARNGGALGFIFGSASTSMGQLWQSFAPGVRGRLAKLAKASGLTPQQIGERLSALGENAVLADVAETFLTTADTAASKIGAVQQQLANLQRRDAAKFGRIAKTMTRFFGDQAGEAQTAGALRAIRSNQGNQLYEQAYSEGIQNTRTLVDLFRGNPVVQSAWRQARKLGASDPTLSPAIRRTTFDSDTLPSLRGWQAIRESIDDQIGTAVRAGKMKKARTLRSIKGAIVDELEAQNQTYANAASLWSGTKRADEMLEAGERFMNMSSGELNDLVQDMSRGDREFFMMGAGAAIDARLEKIVDSRDMARLFRNEGFRRKLRTIMPDGRARSEVLNTLEAERIFKETSNRVAKGSQTKARQVAEQQLAGRADIATGAQAAAGGARGAALSLIDRVGAPRAETVDQIGQLLLSPDPAVQQQAIAIMQRGQQQLLGQPGLSPALIGAILGGQAAGGN